MGESYHDFYVKTESKAQATKFADEFICSVESDTVAPAFEKLSRFAESGGTLRMNKLAIKRKYEAWKILNDESDDWSPMFAACAQADVDSLFEASVVVSTASGKFDKSLDYKYSGKELSVAEHVFAEQSMGGWCKECYRTGLKKAAWQNLVYSAETAKWRRSARKRTSAFLC